MPKANKTDVDLMMQIKDPACRFALIIVEGEKNAETTTVVTKKMSDMEAIGALSIAKAALEKKVLKG